jgi:hypothetical protein
MAVFPGIMPMCRLGTSDRPLRAVRIDVTTPVRPADGRGVHVDRGDRHGAERERQDDEILRKIFHRFLLHLRQKNLVCRLGLVRRLTPLCAGAANLYLGISAWRPRRDSQKVAATDRKKLVIS